MRENVISAQSKAYFEFIEELRSAARLDSPTIEISRLYNEVADILDEAFDEFNVEDLPKYQRRLETIIKLQTSEETLKDPLFKEDLERAEKILEGHVKKRFGTFQKIRNLAGAVVRGVGGSSEFVNDFLAIGDRAENAGRRIGEAFGAFTGSFKAGRRGSLNTEEERQIYDTLKGNNQYNVPGSGNPQTVTSGYDSKGILPVKDDKLIGTNTQQNKLLIDLYKVSKETNVDIKKIRVLLSSSLENKDDSSDKSTLNNLESQQEASVKPAKAERIKDSEMAAGSASGAAGSGAGGGSFGLLDYLGLGSLGSAVLKGGKGALGAILRGGKSLGGAVLRGGKGVLGPALRIGSKALPWLGKRAAAAATGPVGMVAGTALTAYEVGSLANDYVVDPAMKAANKGLTNAGQSLATTIGEKTKGIEYYKNLFKSRDLDIDSQNKAEKRALEFLKKTAKEKRELYKESYSNGARYGNGKYQINDQVATIDEAIADVNAAEKQAKDYEEYLKARDKAGRGLPGYSVFKRDDKIWSNPLYTKEEMDQIQKDLRSPAQNTEILRSDIPRPTPVPAPVPNAPAERVASSANKAEQKKNKTVTPSPNPEPAPAPTPVDAFLRGLASAETGKVTDDKGILHESRFIRTKAGSNSSAYGSVQITKSLAQGSLDNGAFDENPELKKWVEEKFIPQGRKFLRSDYSDDTYGAGGAGELNSPEDRQKYMDMARVLAKQTLDANNGDVLGAIGEWRFGANQKHKLLSKDPKYAEKVLAQLKRDKDISVVKTNPAEVIPAENNTAQLALNNLSKDYEMSRMQPVVVPVPMPAPAPQEQQIPQNSTPRSVGASSNGASEASLMVGIRHSTSPLS